MNVWREDWAQLRSSLGDLRPKVPLWRPLGVLAIFALGALVGWGGSLVIPPPGLSHVPVAPSSEETPSGAVGEKEVTPELTPLGDLLPEALPGTWVSLAPTKSCAEHWKASKGSENSLTVLSVAKRAFALSGYGHSLSWGEDHNGRTLTVTASREKRESPTVLTLDSKTMTLCLN